MQLAVFNQSGGRHSRALLTDFAHSPHFVIRSISHMREGERLMRESSVQGILVLGQQFDAQLDRGTTADVQLIVDGTEPNVARFVQSYAQAVLLRWQGARQAGGVPQAGPVGIEERYWYNPTAKSERFLVPGAITVIMTLIGTLLTSLVFAREWERGTMEAMLATPVSRWQMLLGKLIPYYCMGMFSMGLCALAAVTLFGVPYRGSVGALLFISSVRPGAGPAHLREPAQPAAGRRGRAFFRLLARPAAVGLRVRHQQHAARPAGHHPSGAGPLFQYLPADALPDRGRLGAVLALSGGHEPAGPAHAGAGLQKAGQKAGCLMPCDVFPLPVRRMLAIVRKELLVLFCNPVSRMLIIVPPLMQIVVFGWAATMEVRHVDVAVLNHDNGPLSREIVRRLEGSPTFRHVFFLRGQQEVRPAIEQEKALFVMVFDAEFSRRAARGEPVTVQLLLDGRRSNAAQIAAYYVQTILAGVAAQTPPGRQAAPAGGGSLDIRQRSWFNPNFEFQWFFLPNLIGMLSFMLGLVVTGLSVAREREAGTFDQLLVSPATPTEIALAKLIPGCVVGLAHGTIFLLVSVFGFGVPFTGSVVLLYVAVFIFSLAAGGIGLMISSLSSTQQQAFLGAFTVGVPCILLSGAVTPVINMPVVLQHGSQLNPIRHFTTLVQGVFLRDITFEAASVSLLKICAITVVCVCVAVWMFRRRV